METEIVGFGKVRCLNCGELVTLAGEIHFCNAPKRKWLDEQKIAVIEMPDGKLFDMKNKEIILPQNASNTHIKDNDKGVKQWKRKNIL